MNPDLFVGVGAVEAQWLPFAVLRHSILKHTRRAARVEPLYATGIEIPVPKDERNRQKTPFSFQRFIIPEACGFVGRAIYLDSDMLVFDDIGELLDQELGEANVLAVPNETSVLVLECGRLTWNVRDLVNDLDDGRLSYDSLMTCRSVATVAYSLPRRWNWLDNSPTPMPAGLGLVHYTVTSSQPWVSSGHPLGRLWLGELFAALDDGSIQRSDVEQAVVRGFVRPSLLHQIDRRVTTKAEVPVEVLRADEPFAEYCRSVRYVITNGFKP